MPIKQRGNKWQVTVGSGSDRFRVSADTRAEALQIEEREIQKRKREKLGPELVPVVQEVAAPAVTIQKVFETACKRAWRDDSGSQKRNAERVVEMLGHRTSIQDVNRKTTVRELVEELYELGNSGATINRKLSALSVLLRTAEDEDWIETAVRVPRESESKHRTRFYTVEEEDEMLEICTRLGMENLSDYIAFMIDTGFRLKEGLYIEIHDCDQGEARLHNGATKSGWGRTVPLTERCQKIVAKRKAAGYIRLFEDMSNAQLRLRWDILRDNMRNPGEHFIIHTMRHTCGTRLAIAGHNASFIQAWLGHSSILVTQRYMNLASAHLTAGVESLAQFRKTKRGA